MENFTKIVTDLKDLIQNTLTKAVRTISGPSEEVPNLENYEKSKDCLIGRSI